MCSLVLAGWLDGCACSRIALAVRYATPTVKVGQACWRHWFKWWLHLGSVTWGGFLCVYYYRKRAGNTINLDMSFVTVITTEVARLLTLSELIEMSLLHPTTSGTAAMWMLQVSTPFLRGPQRERCTDRDYGRTLPGTDEPTSPTPFSRRMHTGCRRRVKHH